MEPLVTSAQMHACDRYAIDVLKIPSIVLMENAGRGVVEAIERRFGNLIGKSIAVFCGKGSNGGDGFAAARHLLNSGSKVTVVMLLPPGSLGKDAKSNYQILDKLDRLKHSGTALRIVRLRTSKDLRMLPDFDFIIDGIFGTGFKGKVTGTAALAVNWINASSACRVSIDLPSGLNADSGLVENSSVRSHFTPTIGLKKIGLMVNEGKSLAGVVEVINLGLPGGAMEKFTSSSLFHVVADDIAVRLPRRASNAHKHRVGKLLVIAGSTGMTGAAALASMAALRSGSGSVVLATPKSSSSILSRKLTEVMVHPQLETGEGGLGIESMNAIGKWIDWADLLVIGPGMSRNPETTLLIRNLIQSVEKPILLDADGLNAFEGRPSLLSRHRCTHLILTPHAGELSRITGLTSVEIEQNKIEIGRKWASKLHAILVIKGSPTVIAHPNGEVFINSTGNPGMATAGSGDVLSGIIAGLWGQRITGLDAAICGCFLHGRAGDIAAAKLGEKSILATDIVEALPDAFRESDHIRRDA